MNGRTLSIKICAPLACTCLLVSSVPARAQLIAPATLSHDEERVSRPLPAPASAGTLFHDTIRDFGRLPSQETLTWLGIGAFAATVAHSVDRPISDELSSARALDSTFDAGKSVGGARLQFGSALATLAVGHIVKSPKVATIGADLVRAQIISQALTAGIKLAVGRTRPDGTSYSFPSGHTSVTFASATVLTVLQRHLGWKAGIPAYALASYVATSRIQEKRHYLSDVAFGATIGIVSGRTVTIGRGDNRFAVSPMATQGGGGVSFTLVGRQ
jgi:membrane-associated phospholipid phosphatase